MVDSVAAEEAVDSVAADSTNRLDCNQTFKHPAQTSRVLFIRNRPIPPIDQCFVIAILSSGVQNRSPAITSAARRVAPTVRMTNITLCRSHCRPWIVS